MRRFLIASFLSCFFAVHTQTIDTNFDVKAGIKSSKTGGVRVIQPYIEGYLIGGFFDHFQGTAITSLAKVDASGTLDEKFNIRFDPAIVYDFAILDDNSILVVGGFQKVNDAEHFGVVKILPNGTVDEKFTATGLTKGGVARTVAVDDKGEAAFIGGEFAEYETEAWNNIVKISPVDGMPAQSFSLRGAKGGTGIYDIDYMPGAGRMVVAGEFDTFNDESYVNVIRILDDGSTDESFKAITSKGRINAIDITTKDNAILMGGAFEGVNGAKIYNLALLDANGNLVSAFNAGEIEGNEVNNVEYPDSGPVVIVGDFVSVSGLSRPNVALINPSNGQAVAAIGPGSGIDLPGYAISSGVNGGIIIGGDYATYNCEFSYGVTKIQLENAGEPTLALGQLDVKEFCAGDNLGIRFTAEGNFCNNTFQVQLSDSQGDFSSPVIIGTLRQDVERGKPLSASVAANIPVGVQAGVNYAIRVVGTSPGVVSNVESPVSISAALGTTGAITGPGNTCAGTTVSYSVPAVTGATGYSWSLPADWKITGGEGTNAITVNVGTSSGAVRVTPGGDCGKGSSSSLPVSVLSAPPNNIGNLFGPDHLCIGINTEFGFDGAGGNYTWSVPAGVNIISGQGTSLLTVRASSSAADGQVSVIQTNDCGSSNPSTKEVKIFQIQNAGPIVASNETPCEDEIVTLTVKDVDASDFSWQQFDGITPLNDSTETVYTFRTNGNSGNITYNFSFNQCGDAVSFPISININSKPNPEGMGTLSLPSVICENEAGVVMSVPPVVNATGYQWTLPADVVITSGDDTESITATVGTTEGLITVAAYNECGFGGSQETSLNLNSIPSALSSISGPDQVCEGEGASYAVDGGARINSYAWSLPVGATFASDPDAPSVEVNFASNGGVITVAAQNVCGTGPASQLPVSVGQLPVIGQIIGPVNPCALSTGVVYEVPPVVDAISYTWVAKGLEVTAERGNQAAVSVGTDQASISVIVENSCGVDRADLEVTPSPFPDDAGPINGNARMCPGSTGVEYFIDPVKNAENYLWTLPKGASIIKGDGNSSITVDFADADGIISVVPQNSCGSGGASERTITFNPLPQGQPTIAGEAAPCTGGVYTYSIEPIASATGYRWSLPTDATIASGGGTNVNVRFGKASGNVSVTPFNTCGDGLTGSFPITVDAPPTVSAISGPTAVCEGEIATYTIDPVEDAQSYTWSIPSDAKADGSSNSVDIQFGEESGTISIEVKDACTSVTETLEIVVNTLPGNAGIITGKATVCENEAGVSYSILPVNNASSYIWSAPTGTSIANNGSNAVVVDFALTDGTVTVTPTNICGTGGARSLRVQMDVLEETQPITGPATTCTFSTETFSVPEVDGATSYHWVIPQDAFILSGENSHTIELDVGYSGGQVSVTPQGSCGSGTTANTSYTVINVTPNAGSYQMICGSTTTLEAVLNDGETGVWSVVNGQADFSDINDPQATVTNLAEGFNELRWEVQNGTCSATSSVGIEVTYPVTPSIVVAAGSNPICSGELTSFSAVAQHQGNSPVYVWRKNGTGVGTNAPTYSDPSLVDGDQVSLEMTSSETCVTGALATSNVVTMSVTSTVTPNVSIYTTDNNICEGDDITWTIIDSTGGGATPSFQWFKNNTPLNGAEGNTYQDPTPQNGDEYSVEMITSSSCASTSMATSATEVVNIQTPPEAGFAQNYEVCSAEGVVNLSGSFTGATGIQWTTDGEGTFLDDTDPNTQYVLDGYDYFSSFISLTMQTTGNGVCPPAYAYNTLSVRPSPEVSLGGDLIMCADEEAIVLSAETAYWDGLSWTTSGTGTFSSGQDNSAPSYMPSAEDIVAGSVEITLTASAAGCTDVSESITLTILPLPTTSAGLDQNVCGATASLSASPLAAGEAGTWSVFKGGANFVDEQAPQTNVTGLVLGENTLIWQVEGEQCSHSDTVTITRGTVTKALVEADKQVCTLTSSINANTPTVNETGLWTAFSGGAVFDNASIPVTTATNLTSNTENVLVWTITRGGCSSSDTLRIEQVFATQANAGVDVEVCADSVILAGNSPVTGELGAWSLYTGEGLIENANLVTTKVNFLEKGENQFIYSIAQNGCSTYDTVVVVNNEIQLAPIPATNICGNQTTLTGVTNEGEHGIWAVVQGAGDFTDDADPATLVQNMAEGINRYRLIVEKGSCADTVFQTVTTEFITTPIVAVAVGTNPICNGELTSFSASLTSGGTSPVLQWKLNGANVGNSTKQFESNSLTNGDEISLEMISNKACVTAPSAISNTITMVVTTNVVPTTAISVTEDSLCGTQPIIFTVTDSTGGGQTPTFEWFRNGGILLGNNGNKLTITDATNEDEFFVRMTTSSSCATKSYDSSDVVPIHVFELPVANAGTDFITCGPDIQLNGNALEGTQTGNWSLIANSTATFENPSVPMAVVGDVPDGHTDFVWTISQQGVAGCEDADTVTVEHIVLRPDAGSTQTLREDFTTLTGSDPGNATGQWISLNPNNSLTQTSAREASVTSLVEGINRFVWTLTLNGCVARDTVNVYFQSNLPLAEAGPDQSVCVDATTLEATPAQTGATGVWSLYQGAATIVDPSSPTTDIINMVQGKNIFVWTVDNGLQSSDTVIISYQVPIVAVPDTIEMFAGDSLGIDVLINDTTSGGDLLKLAIIQQPVFGKVTLSIDSTVISFTSEDPTILGNDTVIYRVFNQCAAADTGLVVVQTLNSGPELPVFTIETSQGKNEFVKYAIALLDVNQNIDYNSFAITYVPENLKVIPQIFAQDDSLYITIDLSRDKTFATEEDSIKYEICDVFGLCAESKVLLKVAMIVDGEVSEKAPPVTVYEGISPNGDGKNDTWIIENINAKKTSEDLHYPNAYVQVINRWGEVVYSATGYETPWDGTNNGQELPDGTYYYVIDLRTGGKNDRLEGYILLKK